MNKTFKDLKVGDTIYVNDGTNVSVEKITEIKQYGDNVKLYKQTYGDYELALGADNRKESIGCDDIWLGLEVYANKEDVLPIISDSIYRAENSIESIKHHIEKLKELYKQISNEETISKEDNKQ